MKFNCCQTKKSKKDLKKVIDFLKIIAEENRLKILCILQEKELCVCDIWNHLDLPQNLVSHHLKVLKNFRLVSSRKEGVKVIYFLQDKNLLKYQYHLSIYLKNKL